MKQIAPAINEFCVRLQKEGKFWQTEDGLKFVEIDGQSFQLGPVNNSPFVQYVQRYFFQRYKRLLNPGHWAMITMLVNSEHFEVKKVFCRVGGNLQRVLVDPADGSGLVYALTPKGIGKISLEEDDWRAIRSPQMLPLVKPDFDVAPQQLLEMLGELMEADRPTRVMLLAWLFGCLLPGGPYPVLAISGGQGAGKSSVLRMLRAIIDPHVLDMRPLLQDDRDFQAAVRNSFILAFDNVSALSAKMSDLLCMISTGTGAQGGRKLYTDFEESASRVCRPVAFNGIPDVLERGDLVDRVVRIELETIPAHKRKDDPTYWALAEKYRPKLLGGLFNAVLHALRNYDSVKLPVKPRMGTFAVWVTAAEEALGFEKGEFLDVYMAQRSYSEQVTLSFDGTAMALSRLMEKADHWTGTYAELLEQLRFYVLVGEHLPSSARGLAAQIRRLSPLLKNVGIEVKENGRGTSAKALSRFTIDVTKAPIQ